MTSRPFLSSIGTDYKAIICTGARCELSKVYEQAGFDLAIDYSLEPISPLKQEDRVWADALLREKGLR